MREQIAKEINMSRTASANGTADRILALIREQVEGLALTQAQRNGIENVINEGHLMMVDKIDSIESRYKAAVLALLGSAYQTTPEGGEHG